MFNFVTYTSMLCTMPRGQSSGHRALAHLLAALSIATSKQAKEPILYQQPTIEPVKQ